MSLYRKRGFAHPVASRLLNARRWGRCRTALLLGSLLLCACSPSEPPSPPPPAAPVEEPAPQATAPLPAVEPTPTVRSAPLSLQLPSDTPDPDFRLPNEPDRLPPLVDSATTPNRPVSVSGRLLTDEAQEKLTIEGAQLEVEIRSER